MLIDTHSHIYLDHFKDDIDAAIQRAKDNDLSHIIIPNIDVASLPQVEKLHLAYPKVCLPAIGMHPCSVKENYKTELATLRKYIDDAPFKIYGIGEIGLDYYWDKTFVVEQKAALVEQINWAKELQLPIILHARDSFDDLYELVAEHNDENLSGIFHCFGGSMEDAEKIMQLGNFYMGLGGVLTFKKTAALRETVKDIPMEYLVLETDAPYLSPTPFRGKRNESSYVLHVAETLATVKQMGLDEIGAITSANARRLFGIKN